MNKMYVFGLFVLISLFSCGKAKDDGAMTILNAMGYGDNSNQEGLSWVRILQEFEEANPDTKIESELLYDEAYHQKVVARLASGDVPDLAYMGADARWGAPWKNANQQWDHRKFIDTDFYNIDLIPAHGPNGEIFEIPIGTSNITTVLFMNTRLLEELGLSEPQTYEDLVAMVPVAQEAGIDVVTIDGADGWALGSCLLSAFIARTSGDPNWVSKALAGKNKFNDPAFVQALGILEQIVSDGVFSKKAALVDYGSNISNFNNDKALFMVQGQWAAGAVENSNVADRMKLLAWPQMPGESANMAGSVAAASSVGYGLTKNGASDEAKRDLGLAFIKYFNSPEEVEQRLRDGAIVAPILRNFNLPSDLPNATVEKVRLANSAVQTEVIDAFLAGEPNEVLMAGAQKILTGQSSAQEVADEIEEAVKR